MSFTVDTLDMSAGSTALNLTGTTGGAGGVNIGNLTFAGGNSLTVNSLNGGTMTGAGNINVTGKSTYDSPIAWDASGKVLNFNLNGVTAANNNTDVSLSAPGSAGVTLGGTTLNLTNTNGLASLNLGGKYTLIEKTTGAFASQSLTDVTNGAETHGFVANADNSLYVFKNKEVVTGDHAITGPASYTAGSGTNESILLDVGGTLTVSGGGLTMTDNGANSATLNAGTLIAPELTLNGANAKAIIGTLDMSGGSTTLNLTGTNAANVTITTASLSGGNLFTLNNTAGDMTLGALNVTGSGRLFVADGTRQSITNLNAAGADLTFVLPAGVTAGQTIVSVGNANLDNATIGVNDDNGRVNMVAGESVKLLAASTSLSAMGVNLTVQTANGDVFDVQVNAKDITLILQSLSPYNPYYERLKAYAEGRAASLAFVNQGQELIINQGFGSALAATSGPGFRMNAFGGMGGGKSRYNSGSHVDVEGFSMLAGLAFGNDVGTGRLTLGAFFEGGWGSYDSHNSFSNYASVKGDGNTSYYGGGVLGRYDLTSGALSGLYFDASARMGRAKADFNTDDIKYSGSDADFDSASLYYGLHGGLGYVWNINDAASLDLSAKLLWTRQESDSVSVHGDDVRFKDADSLRTRLGGRFTYAVNEYVTPYAGAYWEHEFDGKQRSTVNGVGIGSPSLKGDTGMGELGLSFRPFAEGATGQERGSALSGLSFDLGVQGYTGQREGVSGNFQVKFEF